jgi:metal-sulfur cluster biosynthetic enzyme
MFIQAEATPDPARLRFLPGRAVYPDGTLELRDAVQAAASPLAVRLFEVPGVSGVSLGPDSVTVTKASGDWRHLKPAILGAIMEHFMSGAPVVRPGAPAGARAPGSLAAATGESSLVDRVRDALRQVIDPELGYNIVDLGFVYDVAIEESGVVRIIMTTTTPGCPATGYLKAGAAQSAGAVPGAGRVEVTLTYQPRWTPAMMSAEAKAQLGIDDDGGRGVGR